MRVFGSAVDKHNSVHFRVVGFAFAERHYQVAVLNCVFKDLPLVEDLALRHEQFNEQIVGQVSTAGELKDVQILHQHGLSNNNVEDLHAGLSEVDFREFENQRADAVTLYVQRDRVGEVVLGPPLRLVDLGVGNNPLFVRTVSADD